MLDSIVRTIEVPCGQEEAFGVFVHEMDSWWPLDKFSVSAMGGEAAKSLRVEARQGGDIVEVGPDGVEHRWGTIRTYDPHDLISMDFHIPEPTDPPGAATLVEVRFTSLGSERTRVRLTQSNWKSLGGRAEMKQAGYGMGWGLIFEQSFKSACGG